MRKPKVAFICVHNSCRSQIAEALGKKYAGDVFESYSAGTQIKDQINQDAVRLMKDIYNIDMEKTQYSKLISDLPNIDISITMGCDVVCPLVENQYTEDWNLEDPTGQDDEFFKKIISEIEKNIKDLSLRIKKNEINLNGKYL
ncbi:arsenate reductase ArsC [Ezakiella peruensis]|uniref:arsenate reductase ArsC n=1 Tax=Ezakiella peruensis TaxID=1464038 RepID=UPI000C1B1C9A|nr:arsenate reductase ArsC [Ezakiella peruensis]